MAAPNVENIYVLSPMQQGLLFHSLYAPGEGLYVDQVVMDLPGDVDAAVLERAWRHVIARHPVLRTSFHWQGLDKPLQVVHPAVQAPFVVEDWRGAAPGRLEAFLEADRRRGFDVTKPPLLRFTLARVSDAQSVLVWTYHHILLDAWSGTVLNGEVLQVYQALALGRTPELPPVRPFGEYVAWLRRQDPAAVEAFWRDRLAGFRHPTSLALPDLPPDADADGGDGGDAADAQGDETRVVPAAASAALRAFARSHQLTLNTVVQGAWALLLHLYGAEDDVVFGATLSGRPAEIPGIESMVGLFINTLPVRVRFAPGQELVPWLRSIQRWQTEMQAFEHSPLAEVQKWSEVPAGQPLFESIVVFENVPGAGTAGTAGTAGAAGAGAPAARPAGEELGRYVSRNNYPLSLVVLPEDELRVRALYDRRRFGASAGRMLEHLAALLEGVAAAVPGTLVEDLSPLTAAERRRVVEDWNATAAPFPAEATVDQLFAAVAAAGPGAVAIEEPELRLTYDELNRRANQLAHRLRRLGVGPEAPVGLCVERSADLVVGMLGILKAGGAYVPLDPGYPEERLSFLLADTALSVMVTRERELARLPEGPRRATRPVLLDDATALAGESDADPPPLSSAGGLAYVMYTSGSTGRPKGVEVVHRAITRLVCSGDGFARFGPGEVFVHLAPPSFDAATFEVWGALLHGARLAILPARSPTLEELGEAVRRHGVTNLWLTVGLFHSMAEGRLPDLKGVSRLLTGGDVVSPAAVRKALEELPGTILVNCYGPTENTTFTSYHPMASPAGVETPLPIGRPIANTRVYLLDRSFRPVPAGVAGELCTGGDGLARGYFRRPDLTAERFVPDPLATTQAAGTAGGRLYRTGDLARWRPDGTLEFLGRLDRQVKIRGFRVEPGEVEAVLAAHPGVGQAAVIVRSDLPGGKGLVAWFVPREPGTVTGPELRAGLAARLPDFMVPALFVEAEALPLDPNGKVDRRALAGQPLAPPAAGAGRPYAAPCTPVEELLASLWMDVLRRDRVGTDDDFLELGGHSLLAMQLLSRIREAFKVDLPLAAVFEEPTVAGQAVRVEEALRQARGEDPVPPLVPVGRDVALPLSFAQQRLWILDRLEPGLPAYNIPLPLRVGGVLSPAVLDTALGLLVERHEALRTRFGIPAGPAGGEPVQVIDPPDDWHRRGGLSLVDLAALPPAHRAAEMDRLGLEEAGRRFDLAAGPLLRGILVRLAPTEHVLLLTVHHIVADGWSMGILYRELAAFYSGAEAVPPARPALPSLPVQYADFAVWQRRWLAGEVLRTQVDWWRERLEGLPSRLELPTDRPRPPLRSYRGARVPFALPSSLAAGIRTLATTERVTLFMTLLAGLAELLGRLSGQEDLAVGSPVANRTRLETEGLIGFFANTLVLRADLAGRPTVRQLLARLRETTVGASTHQDVPFEKLVEDLEPERSLTFTPFFQVLFTLDRPPLPADLSDLAPATMTPQIGSAKFDLTFTLMELPDGLVGSVEHTTDLFDATTALRLAGQLETLLAGFVVHPERPAGELPLLAEAERHQVLVEANDPVMAPPVPAATLHGLFFHQAERTPDRPALHSQWGTLTYGELRRRVDALAGHLRRLGVGPEVPAAVFLDRRPELVVSLLAILAAGGAYVPLDPAYPRERVSLTLDDCRAPVVVTRGELADRLPDGPAKVLLDEPAGVGEGLAPSREGAGPSPTLPTAATPHNLAYLIYTSGSTGRPKGVAIEHRSAVALLDWAAGLFPEADLEGVLASTSVCFDLSVFEIFLPLARGGTIVLAASALDLLAMGDEAPVTLVNTVPSAAVELTRGRPLPAGVRTLNMAGEPIPPALVARLAAEPRLGRVFNLYGPSEATTYSTWERVALGSNGMASAAPAIGRPIAGTSAYVVDRGLRPLPPGVPGELWLGGAGLARGYLGRPELTAAGFVPDPFGGEPGARLYRTGDLVRRLPDGRLDFLGRIDHQVKVRGFRIELGEIEAVLARHPQVAAVTTVVREGKAGTPEERRLVAYVVPRDGANGGSGTSAMSELRAFVRQALPEFMVPSDFVALRALPLTPSGKVDRKALPEPGALRLGPETVYAEPKSALEQTVAGVLREVLGLERVGLNDNFFDLGGHSLRLVRVAAVLEERLRRPVQVLDLFRSPTVALLCAAWAAGEAPAAAQTTPEAPPPSPEELEQRADDRRQGRARRRELRLDRAGHDQP